MDLERAIRLLPAGPRQVLVLHDVEGYTHKEIASLMGKTESFSKSQLSRAYQRLRPYLDSELERQEATTTVGSSVTAY